MSNKEEIVSRIRLALDKIRPFLMKDEGDIALVELTDDMDVKVELLGACRTCQYTQQTLQSGVVQFIKREAPEIRNVISV
jgi:Fe-S cluster biogenesis protein NfuA